MGRKEGERRLGGGKQREKGEQRWRKRGKEGKGEKVGRRRRREEGGGGRRNEGRDGCVFVAYVCGCVYICVSVVYVCVSVCVVCVCVRERKGAEKERRRRREGGGGGEVRGGGRKEERGGGMKGEEGRSIGSVR